MIRYKEGFLGNDLTSKRHNLNRNQTKILGTITKKFKLNQKVKDESFEVDHINQYCLSLEVGRDSFRMCIIDTERSRCLWLEDYRFSSIFFTEQLLDQLQLIYEDHHVLKAGFWKTVRVSVKNQLFTLIPGSLFKREQANDYLQLLREEPASAPEDIYSYRHASNDIVNVFTLESSIASWFKAVYPAHQVEFIHQASALIEGIIQNVSSLYPSSMFAYVDGSYLTIVVVREKSLAFCNTFFFANTHDFIYYVMFVISELKLNPETIKLTLYGGLNHDSAIFNTLYKYIRHVVFGEKPKFLRFSYLFDEVLDHQYFNAYNISLCE